MGEKATKLVHQASRIEGGPAAANFSEKEEILKIYSSLREKERFAEKDPSIDFPESGVEKIEVSGLIVELRSNSEEIIIDGFKKLERLAERNVAETNKALPLVIEILMTDPREKIRYEATKAIAKIKNRIAVDALMHAIKMDSSEKVKEGAVKALGLIRAGECTNHLVDILNDVWDQSIRVRKAAAFSLGRLDPKVTVNILCDSLINDPDMDVRCEAAESIAICLLKIEKNQAGLIVKTIVSQLDPEVEAEHEVRIAVINVITVAENLDCTDELIGSLENDPHLRVRGQAAHALAHFFDPRIERALIARLDKEEGGLKKRIALALAQYAMKNPLGLHDEVCDALIHIQEQFPRGSYIWKEAVKALPAC